MMMVEGCAGIISGRRLTRLRALGRGASGADVSLFAADDELVAVKSARVASGAEELRREGRILASLSSPYVLPCLGSRVGAGGEYQLFLEFAPGGSLADEVERNGGCLEEGAVRAYAADVARGLAYLHGESVVHGDVKGRNVVIGADGWAKLADFGCARSVGSVGPIGATPAFMAPEVARGEEQGPAADVWALGCTVIEMATGRAPWSDMDDVFAAVRLIGYTDAVPQAPKRLSEEGNDFLDKCFRRRASDRWTAAQLLEHPFLAPAGCGVEAAETKSRWVSPKSTLDAAMWESDAEEDEKIPDCTAERIIRSLAASTSALPDWESDDGWIEVWSGQSQTHSDIADSPVEETAFDAGFWDEELEAELAAQAKTTDAAILVDAPAAEHATSSDEGFWDEELEAELAAQSKTTDAAIPVAAPAAEQTTSSDEGLCDEELEAELAAQSKTTDAAIPVAAPAAEQMASSDERLEAETVVVDHGEVPDAAMNLSDAQLHNVVGLAADDACLNQQQQQQQEEYIFSDFSYDPIVLGVDITSLMVAVNPVKLISFHCQIASFSSSFLFFSPLQFARSFFHHELQLANLTHGSTAPASIKRVALRAVRQVPNPIQPIPHIYYESVRNVATELYALSSGSHLIGTASWCCPAAAAAAAAPSLQRPAR